MTDGWNGLLAFFIVSTLLVGGIVAAGWILKVKARRDSPLKRHPYECGEEAAGPSWIRFHPRYYVVALFFVLFDVEAAFLFPWAVAQRALGWTGFGAIVVFTGVLMLGWWYALRKGALRWQ
jgi:NADH-quinone oxidoreductase subunit A